MSTRMSEHYIDANGKSVLHAGRPQGCAPTMLRWGCVSPSIVGAHPCGRPVRGHHGAGLPILTFALLFALILSLFSLPASAHAITSTNTGHIYGQLLDGTKKNAPVAGQSVTLQMAQGNNASDLTKITTDAHGIIYISENFFFENLGSTTYVGSLHANGSKPNALRFSLPPNARQLSLNTGF